MGNRIVDKVDGSNTMPRHWLATQCFIQTIWNMKNPLLRTPNLLTFKLLFIND